METHKLYGLLAEALTRLTFDFVEHPQPPRAVEVGNVAPLRVKAGDSGWGRLLSAFNQAGWVLKELDVVELTGDDATGFSWRYLIDGEAVFDFVSKRVHAKQSTERSGCVDERAVESGDDVPRNILALGS